MSRLDALRQYDSALKQGKKYYNACIGRGESPYPKVLDETVAMASVSSINIGLIEIPIDRIIGTWTGGRKNAFAGNFMPIIESESEFKQKWVNLCEAHLDQGGITDPITCYEYLGYFYVKEGHKRVSVLKSFGAYEITGEVTRLVPPKTDDEEIRLYYEFLDFYKASKLYSVSFSQTGSYTKLQAALGFEPHQKWPEETRRSFSSRFMSFSDSFERLNNENLKITAGDALLVYLKVHPYMEMLQQTDDEIRDCLAKIWPDIILLAKGEPISVNSEPEEKSKSLINMILGSPKLNIAFFYDYDPQNSSWASAHMQGQKHLEEISGNSVTISSFLCGENPDETMEKAVQQGANVIFATTPTLIDSCRRIAAANKNIAVFNCSLSMPYAGVRSYYCRVYEAKYIAGAIAGAMAKDDRIGYIANYPIMGVTAAVNAFALGARLTNPRARITLKWTCLPGDPAQEFMDEGIRVISNRDQDGGNIGTAWNSGTYIVNSDGKFQPLATPQWDWGIYYEKTVQSLLNSSIDALRDSKNAVNDWWGMNSGVVSVVLGDSLPDGPAILANYLEKGIINGELDPFLCKIRDNRGNEINDGNLSFTSEELMRMNWLCSNIEGSIPLFDDLLPISQNLVRLLGIYRETIPPEITEQQP